MITAADVKKISKLCRLRVEGEDVNYMSEQLTNIMHMVNQLQEVNTDNIEPLRSVCAQNLSMRADEVTVSDLRSELFANVSGARADFAKEIKCYIVPKVVE